MTEDLHKILEAYHKDSWSPSILYGIGLLTAFGGFISGNASTTLYGAILTSAGLVNEGLEYYKAYCSARLDFMQNKKFTALDSIVEEDEE